ncbi:hypothetical protein BO82DRAFT_359362 [Aspergillus uvarum CBS 121591]|uniref:Uncharacterized protein n=1 Tax=Aspergillus uvarum CBS 121591 TaxID=1448315 RepID=A0A319BTW4_9EURO|nr:hypothetical protein BO82DRAFT_359362 [Aspergillus uvarum CBS 121591]PYH76165.1 hypothetical protein BO82DRAFT_359362 [Aspergillus uvarum CBS 121591]
MPALDLVQTTATQTNQGKTNDFTNTSPRGATQTSQPWDLMIPTTFLFTFHTLNYILGLFPFTIFKHQRGVRLICMSPRPRKDMSPPHSSAGNNRATWNM